MQGDWGAMMLDATRCHETVHPGTARENTGSAQTAGKGA